LEIADKYVEALYQRLDDVRRASSVSVEEGDLFELGINCRLANEEMWLKDFLDQIEKNRNI
jgi:hypothetical protein